MRRRSRRSEKTRNPADSVNWVESIWVESIRAESAAVCNMPSGETLEVSVDLSGRPDLEKIRRRFAAVLPGVKGGWKLASRGETRGGYLFWRRCPDFRVDDHVEFLLRGGRPAEYGDDRELCELLEERSNVAFLPDRPPWEALVIPKSSGEEYSLAFRYHHGLGDGVSMVRLFFRSLASRPAELLAPRNRRRMGFLRRVWFRVSGHLGIPANFVSSFVDRDRSNLVVAKVNGTRSFALSRPIGLDRLRRLRTREGATINEIFIAVLGGGLHRWMQEESAKTSAYFAVAVHHPDEETEMANRLSIVRLVLPVGSMEPGARLKLAKESTRGIHRPEALSTYYDVKMSGNLLPTWLAGWIVGDVPGSVDLSNVPGPKERVTLFGDDVTRAVAWSTLEANIGLSILLSSYAGEAWMTIAADTAVIPNRDRAESLLSAIHQELADLEAASESKSEGSFGPALVV
ncbi:unnamed protein product [Darwinula stevensoni]|uniref:Diacylglycerol O-acyltransferase n=1 Tax=Darwinula stevensoni TaxID=69355 RepID=A0A7R9AFQ6_9CRUS|nr:unnamed protein product [Darwinula stevensoni]CAG0902651.1 unnamed protein product [Darwinula stevensoni]